MTHDMDVRHEARQTVSTHKKKLLFRYVPANTVAQDAERARFIVHALRDPNPKTERKLQTKYFLSGGAST